MTHSRMLHSVAVCALLVGCTNTPMPPRSALLEDSSFAGGLDECAQREPLSTSQLVAFVGKPDITAAWGQIQQTLSSRAGIDRAAVDTAMQHMRDKYALNQSRTTTLIANTLPMDQVEVWLYMWNEPAQLVVSDIFHTPAAKMSILVLVEKGRIVGTTDILFNGR